MRHHLFSTLWGLDFDGIAGKLEALGRITMDIVAGSSAVCAFLGTLGDPVKHPRLNRGFQWFKHGVATLALDSSSSIARLGNRLRHRHDPPTDLKASADATPLPALFLPLWVRALLVASAVLAFAQAIADAHRL